MPEKYVVYFLHYQPERTSLPEGYGFAQQLVAIRLLQNAIPDDCYLVVKEHPSTFTSLCGWKERRPAWYEQLKGEKIIFAPMELDAYKLIDNSMAVSTLTGTIAGEALIRGKSAALLGAGPGLHVPHSNLHRFDTYPKLVDFLANTDISNNQPNKEKTCHMLAEIKKDSFSGLSEEMDYTYANNNYETARIQSILNGFYHLLVVEDTVSKAESCACSLS